MPPVSDKEKNQKMQEKYQAILTAMLRDDDNKYCVDCDAKGIYNFLKTNFMIIF